MVNFTGKRVRPFNNMRRRPQFARKSHSWKYVELDESAIDRTAAASTDVVLFSATDWQLNTASGVGVRNVSYDLRIGVSWSPEVTTVAYNTWYLKWGIWCIGTNDSSSGVDSLFAEYRALSWGFRQTNTGEQPTAQGISSEDRSMHFVAKARQRYVRTDDALEFRIQLNADVNATVADMRVSMFGRFSWETP